MITITNKVDCCGCNACGDVCPKQAISFKTDIEGFWYPEVDREKCVECGLCEKVCPMLNVKDLKKNNLPESICYAAEHKNLEVVFDSIKADNLSLNLSVDPLQIDRRFFLMTQISRRFYNWSRSTILVG